MEWKLQTCRRWNIGAWVVNVKRVELFQRRDQITQAEFRNKYECRCFIQPQKGEELVALRRKDTKAKTMCESSDKSPMLMKEMGLQRRMADM